MEEMENKRREYIEPEKQEKSFSLSPIEKL